MAWGAGSTTAEIGSHYNRLRRSLNTDLQPKRSHATTDDLTMSIAHTSRTDARGILADRSQLRRRTADKAVIRQARRKSLKFSGGGS